MNKQKLIKEIASVLIAICIMLACANIFLSVTLYQRNRQIKVLSTENRGLLNHNERLRHQLENPPICAPYDSYTELVDNFNTLRDEYDTLRTDYLNLFHENNQVWNISWTGCKRTADSYKVMFRDTGSMRPFMDSQHIGTFCRRPRDISPGDIIHFEKGYSGTVHMVVDKWIVDGQEMYATRGLNIPVNDVLYITKEDIVGKMWKLEVK